MIPVLVGSQLMPDSNLLRRTRFQGTELKIRLEDASGLGQSMFQVVVDGQDAGLLRPAAGVSLHTAVTELHFRTHDVEVQCERAALHCDTGCVAIDESAWQRVAALKQECDRRLSNGRRHMWARPGFMGSWPSRRTG